MVGGKKVLKHGLIEGKKKGGWAGEEFTDWDTEKLNECWQV